MDEFDFEELVADMLGITDEQREDDAFMEQAFFDRFEIEMEQGYQLAKALLPHVPKVKAGLSGNEYHAFVSKTDSIMLMKVKATGA